MLERIIQWSLDNRIFVLVSMLLLTVWGLMSIQQTSLDAIPDLSDVQIIIRTNYAGQSPQVVEDQVTYPITTTMLAVPGAKAVRGYSFFGDSYVYVVFEDGTDLYWARSRVLEYLNQAADRLPEGIHPVLGPDATGVGWVYSYVLVDRTGQHDLSQLRSIQDWFLKFELQTVPGVAEIATVGGMVRQYQVIANPDQLRAFGISLSTLADAIRKSNEEVGGSVIEQAEAEYMIHTRGFLTSLEDIERIPVSVNEHNIPVLVRDLATVQVGPEMRRVVADLNGEGEVTGGIVVMRYGENALSTIDLVKQKINELKQGLPSGVEIIETYDRSTLIKNAVNNLSNKLIEELLVVALVCLLFLFHLRSAFVAIVTLPLGILTAFIIMRWQGINANIMSLGGIAIAIGAMVDAAIVMIENTHKHLERWRKQHPETQITTRQHWSLVSNAACEVGPALFFSLLIITLSFIPVFSLQAQEGRLFSPLAFTKTYAMAAAAGLAVTLVPVLMGYFIRGNIPDENKNPASRWLIKTYQPVLQKVLSNVKLVIISAFVLLLSTAYPIKQLGSEFMPQMYEGDLMYMPTTLPGLSIGKAQQLLQQTDRLIASVPEVKRVFGKIGRADTATDPAPLTMIETLIQLKPRDEWRDGLSLQDLIDELDSTVKLPGLTNAWLMPIKTRIDMLSTGIKTPVGIKVSGPDLKVIEKIGREIEKSLMDVEGTVSAYSERITGGRYIEIVPDRDKAAYLGLNVKVINDVVRAAVGGLTVTSTVEGLQRYPVNIRFERDARDDIEKLKEIPVLTPTGMEVALGQVADIYVTDGPPVLKSENARLNGWTFVDIRDVDLGGYVEAAQKHIAQQVTLPAGYSINWAGQFEYLLRAKQKLYQVIPVTLMIIFLLLYLTFKRIEETLMVMLTLPFALIGGYWFMYVLGYHMSVASAVGFIALAGVAAEFGVIMLLYLNNVVNERIASKQLNNTSDLRAAIIEGAVMRVRPKAMTVAVIITGLIPIMTGTGAGSEVMQRIAAPMIGGMITAPLLSLFLIPLIYMLWMQKKYNLPGSQV